MSNYYCLEYAHKYTCEKCGQEVYSKISSSRMEYSGVLPSTMSSALAIADVLLVEKQMKADIEKKNYRRIIFSDAKCPHCGAQQSWCPLTEPVKPGGIGSEIGTAILFAIIGAIAGTFLGLFLVLITDNWNLLLICMAVGAIGAIIVSISIGKTIKQEDEKKYPQLLQEYNEFVEDMKTRTVRNEPVVDWGKSNIHRFD